MTRIKLTLAGLIAGAALGVMLITPSAVFSLFTPGLATWLWIGPAFTAPVGALLSLGIRL